MRLKIIVVGPRYQMNIGYIARVSKNFGVERLSFVRPRANLTGKKAIMFSKHAFKLLEGAQVYNDFDRAIEGCDVIVGTTGIWRKGPKFGREYQIEDALRIIKRHYKKNAVVGLIIGRDDKGLNREELEKCDMVVHIESNVDYPTLNVSHALAVLLYLFTRIGFKSYTASKQEKARKREERHLIELFERMTVGKRIRSRESVRNVFWKMVRRSQLNRHELHALMTALK